MHLLAESMSGESTTLFYDAEENFESNSDESEVCAVGDFVSHLNSSFKGKGN